MGEIFERPLPSAQLAWTGERLTSSIAGQIEIEHLHRYFLARELCRGLDVLDVASGEGYGTALLAQTAKSTVGVELAPDAARHAAANYRLPNLRYLEGDARAIPLPDASVDIVTSFETIEHFYEHDKFLAEIKRVLRPGGKLIVSSPDRDVYSPPGQAANPYHRRELARDEFEALLHQYFAHVAILGQRTVLGSALLSRQAAGLAPLTFERRGGGWFEASPGLPRAMYLLAIASDAGQVEIPSSLFIERDDIGPLMSQAEAGQQLAAVQAGFEAARAETTRAVEEADIQAKSYVGQLTSASEQIRALDERLHRQEQDWKAALAAAQAELSQAQAATAQAKERADAAADEAKVASTQRDQARIGLRRAGVFAENRWRLRVEALEAELRTLQHAERDRERHTQAVEIELEAWRSRYHLLRGRVETLLRRSGILPVTRIVLPRPLRQWALDAIRGRTRS